jgi:alkaline phosphatase
VTDSAASGTGWSTGHKTYNGAISVLPGGKPIPTISIDKQDHAANPCGQIGETVAFDAAIKKALSYRKSNPDTLVVVTAAGGPQAANVLGVTNQTDLFDTMKRALGLR